MKRGPKPIRIPRVGRFARSFAQRSAAFELAMIDEALHLTGNNFVAAADLLGMNRNTFYSARDRCFAICDLPDECDDTPLAWAVRWVSPSAASAASMGGVEIGACWTVEDLAGEFDRSLIALMLSEASAKALASAVVKQLDDRLQLVLASPPDRLRSRQGGYPPLVVAGVSPYATT